MAGAIFRFAAVDQFVRSAHAEKTILPVGLDGNMTFLFPVFVERALDLVPLAISFDSAP
jgi:hypothetical protein